MALWTITSKRTATTNGVHIEKGMSIELGNTGPNPFNSTKGKEQIAQLFMNKYGVDLQKGHFLTPSYFDCTVSR